MAKFAANTEVAVERSKAEIERILIRYGASSFGYATEGRRAVVQFKACERFVRFILPLPDPTAERFKYFTRDGNVLYGRPRADEARSKAYEQECRQVWRALVLVIKAKLEAVDAGITTFSDEFLAHTILPNGETVSDFIQPKIDEAYQTGFMPTSMLALPAPK